jgi:hypothetical protein
VGQGGTGTTSLTANALILGNGTSGFQTATSGSAYQIFRTPSSGGIPAFGSIDLSQSAAVTGALGATNGGLGLTSAPTYGQIPVGNVLGGYTLTATSSLGLLSSIGGLDTYVQFNNAGSLGGSSAFTFNNTVGRLTSTYASTTAFSSGYASSTSFFAGTLSVGSLSGFLKATAGSVATSLINLASDITGTLPVSSGGTGSASAPSYGQLLVGNNSGGYTLTATSSLGLIAGSIGGSDTQVQFNDAGSFAGDSGFVYNKTADRLTTTYASTTAFSSIYASSTSLFAGSLSVGSLSGFLKATAGSVATSLIDLASDVTGFLGVAQGGTGTSTAFTTGSILFATTSGAFSQNNSKLFWTDSSSRFSVVGTVAGTHLKGLGSAPSISAGTGAGIGGLTAAVVSVSGTDTAGTITVTPGNGILATGATVTTLTFASAYGSSPYVILTPSNAVTALLSGVTSVFVGSSSVSNFTITSGTTALTALTEYKWTYQVIE